MVAFKNLTAKIYILCVCKIYYIYHMYKYKVGKFLDIFKVTILYKRNYEILSNRK